MANPSRKMATIRKIDAITPIEGADRIECAHVGGWTVVVKKGEFKPGDLAVYFEIDTFLPVSEEPYAFLASRGVRTMVIDGEEVEGHVLRTAKMRGQYSQGLLVDYGVFGISDEAAQKLCDEHIAINKQCHVREYYKPMPLGAKDFIGRYDPYVAPRTDAERIQNVDQRTFDLVKRTDYETSIKVDGTSITMVFDDRVNRLRIFSHNNEFALDRGMGKLTYEVAEKQGLVGFCEKNHMVTVQAELCGPKIQNNRLRLGEHRLFVFSVWDMVNRRYIKTVDVFQFDSGGEVLGSHVPILPKEAPFTYTGSWLKKYGTPAEFLESVDGIRGAVTKDCLDEGVVIHIYGRGDLDDDEWNELHNVLGDQMQVKAVSNKFLLKAKE